MTRDTTQGTTPNQNTHLQHVPGNGIQPGTAKPPITFVGVTENIQLADLATTPSRFYMANLLRHCG